MGLRDEQIRSWTEKVVEAYGRTHQFESTFENESEFSSSGERAYFVLKKKMT